jgi:translation initiation factor eIF-2B subunit epsilon
MPLVNVPMIDYALEWLCSCGVEEIFVFCCAHRELIQKHIEYEHHLPSFHLSLSLSLSVCVCVS